MRNAKKLLAAVLALVMALALCACGVQIGGEETWEYTADNKEGVMQLYNDFFEETFKNTNQVVTVKGTSGDLDVETIDGTSDYIKYATTDAETWAFLQEDEYIYAMSADGTSYYMTGEDYYNYGYFAYKNSLDVIDMLPEDEGLTYSAEVKGSKNGDNSTATLTIEIKNGDEASITITAEAKNDLVEGISIHNVEDGETRDTTMTIEYGNASVTVPDISDWSSM